MYIPLRKYFEHYKKKCMLLILVYEFPYVTFQFLVIFSIITLKQGKIRLKLEMRQIPWSLKLLQPLLLWLPRMTAAADVTQDVDHGSPTMKTRKYTDEKEEKGKE